MSTSVTEADATFAPRDSGDAVAIEKSTAAQKLSNIAEQQIKEHMEAKEKAAPAPQDRPKLTNAEQYKKHMASMLEGVQFKSKLDEVMYRDSSTRIFMEALGAKVRDPGSRAIGTAFDLVQIANLLKRAVARARAVSLNPDIVLAPADELRNSEFSSAMDSAPFIDLLLSGDKIKAGTITQGMVDASIKFAAVADSLFDFVASGGILHTADARIGADIATRLYDDARHLFNSLRERFALPWADGTDNWDDYHKNTLNPLIVYLMRFFECRLPK